MPVLLKHQPWNDDPEQEEREVEVEWNLWKRRQPPFHALAVGDHVVLVSGGGPANGMLTWEVEVTAVVKAQYGSHTQAWNILHAELGRELARAGVTRRGFMANEYTRRAPTTGWLLGWAYQPVRQIKRPRPPELRFQPNGWATIDSNALSEDESPDPDETGQGRTDDPLLRKRIELFAMDWVYDWLVGEGYGEETIRDTSATRPYDYEVGPESNPELRVEVKGMLGRLGPVEVTSGEVNSARDSSVPTILAVVHDIDLAVDADGERQCSGGQLWLVEPWSPLDSELSPKRFSYDPRDKT